MTRIAKNIASKLHLWLGLVSGLVVFIVALTGSLLVFEEELEPLLNTRFHIVPAETEEKRLPLDHLVATTTKQFPGKKVSRIWVEPQADRTVIVALQQSKKAKDLLTVALNPYSGEIVATRQEQDTFFSVVLQLHRYLCMGETGKVITGISCSVFVIIMITGLILWWPNRKNRKQRLKVKWDASPKRLNWDLHAVLGFYALPFVLLIALTGLVWSYKWVNNLLFYALDGKPQAKRETPGNLSSGNKQVYYLESIYNQINQELPHSGRITFTFPEKDSLAITVSKANDEAPISNIVDFLYFDKNNGQLINKRLYSQETKGFKARRLVYPIHTGSLLGWPTKIIALVVALITASLPITGFVIWLGRGKKEKKKRGNLSKQEFANGKPRPKRQVELTPHVK